MAQAMQKLLLNIALFQIGWFVCILFGSVWAVAYSLLALLGHFYVSNRRVDDLLAVLLCLIIGLAHDTLLIHAGVLVFAESAAWPPLWITCLWLLMGVTLNHSMQWVYDRPWVSAALGAIAGPASYFAGVQLSSAQWAGSVVYALCMIAALWLVVLPLHRFLSLRIKPYVSSV